MLSYTTLPRYLSGTAASRLLLTLLLMSTATITMAWDQATKEEMAMIPVYCPYTQGWDYNSPESKRWEARMGKTFGAMHHYCWAQIYLQRALRSSTPETTKRSLLKSVRDDYLYVLQRSPRDFILLPEIYTRIGDVELHLSRINDANNSFAQARALKPDYWPAYSHWAEFLIRSEKKVEAKQLVKSGLEYSPGSRVLREQYRLLGGNPSEIVPYVKAPTPASTAGETAAPALAEQPISATEANEDAPVTNPDLHE